MLPVINRPTRVQGNSVSLIDNIYCNSSIVDNLVCSGVLPTDISDHFEIFSIFSFRRIVNNSLYIKKRIFSHGNINKFQEQLQATNW